MLVKTFIKLKSNLILCAVLSYLSENAKAAIKSCFKIIAIPIRQSFSDC